VLDAAKALLFGGGDKIAVPQKAGSRIGVIGVNPENDHDCRDWL
jgi:hypothetical protein